MRAHLSDAEIAELRALCVEADDRLRALTEGLLLDMLALRREVHAQLERARFEHERLRDVLARARPLLERDADLLIEVDDLLVRRR